MSDLIFKDEVYRIIGAAMEVYNEMGHGFHELIYQEALALEFTSRGIPFVEQSQINVFYKIHRLKKEYKADYLAYDQLIVEIKAEEKLVSRDESQLINYLKATKLPLGLLINFGNEHQLEWKRLVNQRD
jgi:GxxExxY protein